MCPVSVITFWIKEAQSGGIEGHTPTLERALGGRPKRHFRAARRKFRAQGRAPFHNALRGSLGMQSRDSCVQREQAPALRYFLQEPLSAV